MAAVNETQQATDRRSVCIDWIKARVIPAGVRAFRQEMLERFGDATPAPGGNGLPMSDSWMDNAIRIYHDDCDCQHKNFGYIQISGTGCGLLGQDECIRIVEKILEEWRGRFTRFDCAVDHEGEYGDLIDTMHKACYDGELVGAKRFSTEEGSESVPVRMSLTATKAKGLTGQTLYIGGRGNSGSGRYLRAYDKGLQTGTEEQGKWVRIELETSGEVASQVASRYINSNEWGKMRTVYDAVDFREVSSTGDRHIARRPVCSWWAELVGDENGAKILRATRKRSTASSHVKWMAECVLPNLYAASERLGMSVDGICILYAGEIQTDGKAKGGAALLLDEIEHEHFPQRLKDLYSFLHPKTKRGAA